MKKTLLIGLFSAMALGAYAQGTVVFNDRESDLTFHIYTPQASGVAITGNTATDIPAGTQTYGNGSVLLGGASGAAGTPINYTYGNNFTVQLYAAPGTGDAVSSLLPVAQYTTFMRQTSQAAVIGTFITPSIASDPGIPNTPATAASATVALACWYNAGGTITSLAEAMATPGTPWGESLPINISQLGESVGSPPPTAPELYGMQSFSLVPNNIPEPGTIALGVMGACAFLARRRLKK
ncbi:MAG: PEP-CTERM sorting domain-containing protein [Verrucomicrobiota bacterium]|jgi:hypothetical protein